MDANAVFLSLVLKDSGIHVGSDGAERLCSSMGKLGLALTRPGTEKVALPATSIATSTTDLPAGNIAIEIRDGAVRLEIAPR